MHCLNIGVSEIVEIRKNYHSYSCIIWNLFNRKLDSINVSFDNPWQCDWNDSVIYIALHKEYKSELD